MEINVNDKKYNCSDKAYEMYKSFFRKIKAPADILMQFGFLLDMEKSEFHERNGESEFKVHHELMTDILMTVQDSHKLKVIKPTKKKKEKKPKNRKFKEKKEYLRVSWKAFKKTILYRGIVVGVCILGFITGVFLLIMNTEQPKFFTLN